MCAVLMLFVCSAHRLLILLSEYLYSFWFMLGVIMMYVVFSVERN